MVVAMQTSMAKEPIVAAPLPDPSLTMRTNVKTAATQASADFTKARSLPFAGAGALILSAYGLSAAVLLSLLAPEAKKGAVSAIA
jgi:hypothetical protein